jgi:hypothetical protein
MSRIAYRIELKARLGMVSARSSVVEVCQPCCKFELSSEALVFDGEHPDVLFVDVEVPPTMMTAAVTSHA